MTGIALLSWLALQLVSTNTSDINSFITLQQVEIAYVLVILLHIFDKYSKKDGISIMLMFCFYYVFIAASDCFISNMPLWISNVETAIFCLIILCKTSKLTTK